MKTNRLQLTLISDPRPEAQPLPARARNESLELIARMLVHLVGARGGKGVRDESR